MTGHLRKPSDAELAALDLRVAALLDQAGTFPAADGAEPADGKFAGPIAETVIDDQDDDADPSMEELARQKAARDVYARQAAERLRQLPPDQYQALCESRARALAEFELEQRLAADPLWNRQ